MTPFDFVNSINDKKTRLDPEDAQFVSFLITRAFSFHQDTLFYANEANQHPDLSKTMLYDYLYNIIPKRQRWGKWPKKVVTKDLENVMEYFGYSAKKAEDALKVLTPTQLKEIANSLVKE